MSERTSNLIHITNGVINKRIHKNDLIPGGFTRGRTLKL